MSAIPAQLAGNILTVLIFLPLAGALLLVFLPKGKPRLLRDATFLVTALEFLLSLPVAIGLDGTSAAMQFVQKVPWIPEYGISYHVGVDGISLWLLMLTTLDRKSVV